MAKKTLARRRLDAARVPYRVNEYDPSGQFHKGEEAAGLVGAAHESVYKTLVVLREGSDTRRALLVLIPVADQLDLKALARGLGTKSLRMASQKEAEKLTGMQVGGISALGLRRPSAFEVLIDDRAKALDRVHVSAGARGMDIELSVGELIRIAGARPAGPLTTQRGS